MYIKRPIVKWNALQHSGFGPSDRPIWTTFVRGKLLTASFIFGKSYRENRKKILDQKYPTKNYRSAKCGLSVFEHLKKKFFFYILKRK